MSSKPALLSHGITRRLLDREQAQPKPPDVGVAWLVAALSFLVHFVVLGTVYAFSVFFTAIRADLELENSAASWALSANQFCLLGVGPFAGRAIERFGFRLTLLVAGVFYSLFLLCTSFVTDVGSLIVTFGVLLGLASGFVFGVAVQSVIQWFKERRGVGVGLAVAGSGLGNFVLSLVANEMIPALGWRATVRWFALGAFVVVLASAVGIRRRVYVATTPETRREANRVARGFLHRRPFQMLFWASFTVSFGYITPFLFLRPYALVQGFSPSDATWLLSGLGISSTVGRVFLGIVADKTSKLLMIRLSFLALGISTLCLPVSDTIAKLAVFVAVYGISAGAFIALVAPVCAEYFPAISTPSLTGTVYAGAAVGNLFGAPIAGALIDLATRQGIVSSASYDNAWWFAGAVMLASSIFLFLLPRPVPLTPTPAVAAAAAPLKSLSEIEKADADVASADSFDSAASSSN